MEELVVAVTQMISIDDVDSNLHQMEDLIDQAFKKGQPRIICFPENCIYMRLIEGQKIAGFSLNDSLFTRLAKKALSYQVYLHLGSVALKDEGNIYNSSILITPQGHIQPTYRKIHLFDIQLEGQKPVRESDVFKHGDSPNILEVDSWRLGEAICYDLRFAELFSYYAQHEVDAILLPAAFLKKTGEAHWEVLLRARAIESQAYVIASAQGGYHVGVAGGTRETFGHSLVSDPWGTLVSNQRSHQAGVEIVTLQRDLLWKVRRQIPMKSHRRFR